MYGNYGRQEDLEVVQKNDIELKGSVLLLRTGKLSFAEQVCALMWRLDTPRVTSSVFQGLDLFSCFLIVKVDNAATKGASAVLIYPDTKDYNYRGDTPLFGHVSLHTQVPMLGLSRDEGSRHLALRHIVCFCVCVSSFRFIWVRGTPTPLGSHPSTIPSSPRHSRLAYQKSQLRPSPPKWLKPFYSKAPYTHRRSMSPKVA